MSRNHVSSNVSGFGQFVNLTVTFLAVALIGFGYLSAVGQLGGVA